MAGAEVAALKAAWVGGALVIQDLDGNAVITVNPSSGGVSFANAGGITVSTGILAPTISTASLVGGATISSGLTLDGLSVKTVTTAATLTVGDVGRRVSCAVDGTFITLPVGASTAIIAGGSYTIYNDAAASQVIVITATGGAIIGGGISTSNLFSNTAATAKKGDSLTVVNTGSTSWYVAGMTGTWASTT